MLTISKAMAILGVSRSTMYRLAKAGKLTPIRVTDRGWYRYDPTDVEKFKAECRNVSA